MSRVHPVPGYPDHENMWIKLCNIDKTEINIAITAMSSHQIKKPKNFILQKLCEII